MKIISKRISIRVSNDGDHCSRKCRFFESSGNRLCKLNVLLLTPAAYTRVGLVDVCYFANCKYKRLPKCVREFGI